MSSTNQHMLFLCSTDSSKLYPNNTSSEFIVELGQTYELDGEWTVELTEIRCALDNSKAKQLYVYSNLCEPSYVQNKYSPLLRNISLSSPRKTIEQFHNSYAIKVAHSQLQRVKIYIRDENNKPASFSKDPLYITLRLKKYGGQHT